MIMGGGEFKSSSLLQQMMWSGGTDSKNMLSSLMPCAEAPAAPAAEDREAASSNDKMPPLSSPPSMLLLPHQHPLQISSEVNGGGAAATCSLAISSDLRDGRESNLPGSWSQLLLGGLVGDHEGYSAATALLSKGLEEGPTAHQGSAAAYSFYGHGHGHGGGGGGEEIQTSGTNNNKPQVSQMLSASSPRSCITTSTSPGSNMLDFSNSTVQQAPEVKNHHSDNSSEGNSTASGSAPKKARVQTSSSAQSTLKVRKERLGDRITALHQIVSPFGKTDTASVLQETIGYIRFLLGQIEVLSFPYLGNDGSSSDNTTMQQHTVLASASSVAHLEHSQDSNNHIGGDKNFVQNMLSISDSPIKRVRNTYSRARLASSSSSRDPSPSDDDDMDGEVEILGFNLPTEEKMRKRKESNRESARRSKYRKAAHLKEMEDQVAQLKVENSSLLRRLATLNQKYTDATVDNRVLKANMETLRTKVNMAEDALKRITSGLVDE